MYSSHAPTLFAAKSKPKISIFCVFNCELVLTIQECKHLLNLRRPIPRERFEMRTRSVSILAEQPHKNGVSLGIGAWSKLAIGKAGL
jgi:hypothetical protein